jgi:DNA repair exonuclease SbcCD ATPase subunit
MPIRLKRLNLRNWTTIREAELDFPEKGLVLVVGKTTGSHKRESVGAGKTAVGEAISRALLGVAGRFELTGHYCHDEVNQNMYVKLDADCDGTPLCVELGYKCRELSKTGEGLKFTYGKTEICRARVSDTRAELCKLVGITPELAEWTVFLDGQKLDFNRMSQRSAVELLMTALQQPPWSQYHERSKRALANFKRDCDRAQVTHEEAQRAMQALEANVNLAKKDYDAALAKFNNQQRDFELKLAEAQKLALELKAQLNAAESQRQKLELEARRLEEASAEARQQLEAAQRALERKVFQARHFRQLRAAKLKELADKLRSTESELLKLKTQPLVCPKCGRPLDQPHREAELNETAAKLSELNADLDKFKALAAEVEQDEKLYQRQLAELDQRLKAQGAQAQLRKLHADLQTLDLSTRALQRKLDAQALLVQQLKQGPDRSELERKAAVLAERQAALASAQARVKDTAQALVEAGEAVKVVDYLNTAFSPVGIPNLVLTTCIAPLNHVARKLSNLVSDGSIKVTYKTSRTLVSGEERPDLDIEVANQTGAKRLKGSSKGETGQINLLVAETLAEVGGVAARVAYRWYDEVANSQDPVVRQCVFSYLKDLANSLNILIFLVDHHPEAAQYADHFLVVQKVAEKTSTVFWAKNALEVG